MPNEKTIHRRVSLGIGNSLADSGESIACASVCAVLRSVNGDAMSNPHTMDKIARGILIVTVALWGSVIIAQVYKAGERHEHRAGYQQRQEAYSEGWRDAQCGKGNDCEAGEE